MQRLRELVLIKYKPARQDEEHRLGIRAFSPFILVLQKSIVHFPVFALVAGGLCRHRAGHCIAMYADKGIMVKFQAKLLGIPVQKLFQKRMPGSANRTFVITKLDQGQLSVLWAPDVSATSNFYLLWCVRVIGSLIRTPAQEDRCPSCDSDSKDDDYNRLQQFRHSNIVAQALSFFEKITCKLSDPIRECNVSF